MVGASHETLQQAVIAGVNAMQVDLWHLEINRIPEGYEFLLIIDSENLTARLCEQVAKQVQAALGAEGISKEEIFVDVSSPGLNRELHNIAQCQKYVGNRVCCTFAKDSKLVGVLVSVVKSKLTIELSEGKQFEFDFNEVEKINLREGAL